VHVVTTALMVTAWHDDGTRRTVNVRAMHMRAAHMMTTAMHATMAHAVAVHALRRGGSGHSEDRCRSGNNQS
jgi:hypothetical protein